MGTRSKTSEISRMYTLHANKVSSIYKRLDYIVKIILIFLKPNTIQTSFTEIFMLIYKMIAMYNYVFKVKFSCISK